MRINFIRKDFIYVLFILLNFVLELVMIVYLRTPLGHVNVQRILLNFIMQHAAVSIVC